MRVRRRWEASEEKEDFTFRYEGERRRAGSRRIEREEIEWSCVE